MDIEIWFSDLIAALPVLELCDRNEEDSCDERIDGVFPIGEGPEVTAAMLRQPEQSYRASNRSLLADPMPEN